MHAAAEGTICYKGVHPSNFKYEAKEVTAGKLFTIWSRSYLFEWVLLTLYGEAINPGGVPHVYARNEPRASIHVSAESTVHYIGVYPHRNSK
jgi:hypothetical protein